MNYQIWVALITAFSAVIVASLSYYFTKKHQLALEWRKEKINHYKELLEAISDLSMDETNKREANFKYATAVNTIALVASQDVITALMNYQDEIRASNKNRTKDEHDKLLKELLLSLRKDLGISKNDQEKTFVYYLVGSLPK